MVGTAKKILDEAMSLSVTERRVVAEALLESLEEQTELDAAWRDEILRRIEEVRRDEVQLEPLSAVRRHIREALSR